MRAVAGTFKGSFLAKHKATTGRNFRDILDPVSAYGLHYGPVTRFWNGNTHSMASVLGAVRGSEWANRNPFDERYKEWGEF